MAKQPKRMKNQKDQFDLDTEIVIGMTNKNNQKMKQNKQTKADKIQVKKLKKKKKINRIIKVIILLAIIVGGICFALISPLFNIQEIQVTGNEKINSDTVVSLSELSKEQNLFKFSKTKVRNQIKTNPYIENVTIKRKIPNKVELIVEERKKTFNVEFLNGYAYINNQGYILEISEQKADLPVITGISTPQEDIKAGNRLNDEDLDKLEVAIQIMSIAKEYEIDTKISGIDITDKTNYIITMENEKKIIYLGNESNLNSKMIYIPAILNENQGKEGRIYLNGDINNGFNPRFREKV